MKRFKKLTAGFLGVVMALGVCGFTALAEENNEVKISDEKELKEAITGAITEEDNVKTLVITENFNVTAMVDINNINNINKNIVINGNDHTLTFDEESDKIFKETREKLQTNLDDFNQIMNVYKDTINFLKNNKNNYVVKDNLIYFNSDDLLKQYNDLINGLN